MTRVLYFATGILALSISILMIVSAGLPERATYTGQVIPGQIPVAPELNAIAPPFELYSIDRQRVRLTDLRGQPVIINFWATWCEPCRVEMPVLQNVYTDNPHLRILAVNLGESPDMIREWRDALGLTYDMLMDDQQQVAALYALRGQPSTYVVSPDGFITHIFYGPASESALETAIASPEPRIP